MALLLKALFKALLFDAQLEERCPTRRTFTEGLKEKDNSIFTNDALLTARHFSNMCQEIYLDLGHNLFLFLFSMPLKKF